MPPCALRVGLVLVDRCNDKTGQCDPGGERLSHDALLRKAATWKGIKVLCDGNVLRRVQDSRQDNEHLFTGPDWRRNSYTINWPSQRQVRVTDPDGPDRPTSGRHGNRANLSTAVLRKYRAD